MTERMSLCIRRDLVKSACFVLLIIQFHSLGELWKKKAYSGSCYRSAMSRPRVWSSPYWFHPEAVRHHAARAMVSGPLLINHKESRWGATLWLCLIPISFHLWTLHRFSPCSLRVSQQRLQLKSGRCERPADMIPDHSHTGGRALPLCLPHSPTHKPPQLNDFHEKGFHKFFHQEQTILSA